MGFNHSLKLIIITAIVIITIFIIMVIIVNFVTKVINVN